MWWASVAVTGWCADLRVGPRRSYPTLGDALAVAVPGDRILVDPGRYVEDTDLSDAVDLEIVGSGTDPVDGTVFSGGDGGNQWLFTRSRLVVRDLALDGEGARRGLALEEGSEVEAWNVRFHAGIQPNGGAISVLGGSSLVLHDSLIDGNSSIGITPGGGLFVSTGSSVVLDGVRLVGNQAGGNGGGAWVGADSTLTARRSAFDGNRADLGGGLYCELATTCTVEDGVFEGNTASEDGGAIYALGVVDLGVLRTAFCGNVAERSGGAVGLSGSTATVANATFLDGEAAADGGALAILDGALDLANATFVGNHAGGRGGAVYQAGEATSRSVNDLFLRNVADAAPFAAVDTASGTRTGGWDLYYDNETDVFPARLPNDWIALDPRLPEPTTCAAPLPPPDSPAVDAGDPEILDPDGSRSDIGATGGPDALRDRDGDGAFDGEDCDDTDPGRGPLAPEACNDRDDDCDGAVDEGCPPDPAPTVDPRTADAPEAAAGVGCGCDAVPRASLSWWVLAVLARWIARRR